MLTCKLRSRLYKWVYFFNSGEICCAGSRIYVQDTVYDEFVKLAKGATESITVGDPNDEKSFYGPQTSKIQMDRVLGFIDSGKKDGATVLTGGKRVDRKGFFIEPTIFTDVKEDMLIVKEEIFGPVVTVSKFSTVEEVLKMAHDTKYGLAAGIHTKNISKALYVANSLRAGTVWVNTYNDFNAGMPFGGFGQSGIGRELGKQALDDYTLAKSVRIAGITKF